MRKQVEEQVLDGDGDRVVAQKVHGIVEVVLVREDMNVPLGFLKGSWLRYWLPFQYEKRIRKA